jgi:hypothetical protein
MAKRNRALSVIILPAAVLVWVIGWGLFWIGSKKELFRHKAEALVQKELVFIVPMAEQKQAT